MTCAARGTEEERGVGGRVRRRGQGFGGKSRRWGGEESRGRSVGMGEGQECGKGRA